MKLSNLFCIYFFAVSSIIIAKPFIPADRDAIEQLRQQGLINAVAMPRLHLGCGQQYLPGYVNIDFPPDEHTVQQQIVADIFGDITHMRCKECSVAEIRLHHVFEHFDRSKTLALLCAWHLWLVDGGILYIEVPDFETSIKLLGDDRYTYEQKQVIMRHIFGSHEAPWAIHCDGWYQEKFEHILSALGFEEIAVTHSAWKLTHNITVKAKKNKGLSREQLMSAASVLVQESLVDSSESEQRMGRQWVHNIMVNLGHLLV